MLKVFTYFVSSAIFLFCKLTVQECSARVAVLPTLYDHKNAVGMANEPQEKKHKFLFSPRRSWTNKMLQQTTYVNERKKKTELLPLFLLLCEFTQKPQKVSTNYARVHMNFQTILLSLIFFHSEKSIISYVVVQHWRDCVRLKIMKMKLFFNLLTSS